MLIGRLGKDPEVSYTASGIAVAKFTMATSERWKDESGNVQEKTEWHNIVTWRKLAEICGQYLKKGSKVYIDGKLQTSSWDDKNTGVKKYRTEVIADDMIMLDSKGGDSGSGESHNVPPPPTDADAPPPKDDLPF